MQSVAARIALLAYLVGGIVVPAVHRHEASVWREGASMHAHAGCAHEGHAHEPSAAAELESEGRTASLGVAASTDHDAACGDNCVVCVFAGSPQSGADPRAVAFSAHPPARLEPTRLGPGFETWDGDPNRLRGPPVSVILG